MLSFKESQTGQPLLDYYNETDLDTIDDQPVDYSKKYADQDSEETCSSSKRHLSTTERIDNGKTHYDELKVYCIEGTPLIISSASSMSDLRDIGLSQASENNFKLLEEKVPVFQTLTEISDIEDSVKIDEKSEECELDNSSDKKDPGPKNEENFSKASSPLMFSRSSSVCSLNSFEIASIRDDRSSVSAFSTLTSGLISPSDVPDSPGEAMSPFIHKNKFSFPNNSNEKSMDPILSNFKENSTEQFEKVFDDVPEDNVIIYDDEGDFSSVSNFSALTHHTTHTGSSRMSLTVFHTESISNIDHVSRVKIKYSMKSSENNASKNSERNNINTFNQDSSQSNHNQCGDSLLNYLATDSQEVEMEKVAVVQDPLPSLNVSMEDKEQKCDDYSKENSDDEALLEECIKNGMPCSRISENLNEEPHSEMSTQVKKTLSGTLFEVEPTYSDDESDDLLDQCILLGKPESKNTSMNLSKSPNVSPDHRTVNSRVQENSPAQNCIDPYCENDVSDDENDLLANCILLGKPQSVKFVNNQNESDESPKQSQAKAFSCENDASDDDLLEDCIQLGRPQSVKPNYINSQDRNSSIRNCISQSSQSELSKSDTSMYQQMYSDTLNKPLQNFKKSRSNPVPNVSQCLPSGFSKSTLKNSYDKESFGSSTSRSFSPLGYRDNIPDGTSDVDEDDDDDLVTQCIRAGKLNDKTPKVKQSLPSPTLKQLPIKSALQKKLPDDRASLSRKANSLSQRRLFDAEYLRTGCISPSMIDIDSMCVYRTEDTPLLSPTASISDLSTLSFSEDKVGRGYYLNNSRNSDCSSESEDDELLLQCIQSGMPGNKRAVA